MCNIFFCKIFKKKKTNWNLKTQCKLNISERWFFLWVSHWVHNTSIANMCIKQQHCSVQIVLGMNSNESAPLWIKWRCAYETVQRWCKTALFALTVLKWKLCHALQMHIYIYLKSCDVLHRQSQCIQNAYKNKPCNIYVP